MDFLVFNFISQETLILIIILLFSIIIHEMAHGYTALFLGDNTAEKAGRLTLNPLPHLDLIGSIIIPGILLLSASPFLFGYAKPVPYNPNNLKDKKWGNLKVAIAGPFANFFLAILMALIFFILTQINFGSEVTFSILYKAIFLNIFLAIFNLLPVPPLDGSKIILDILKAKSVGLYMKVNNFFNRYTLILFIVLIFIILNTDFLPQISIFVFKALFFWI